MRQRVYDALVSLARRPETAPLAHTILDVLDGACVAVRQQQCCRVCLKEPRRLQCKTCHFQTCSRACALTEWSRGLQSAHVRYCEPLQQEMGVRITDADTGAVLFDDADGGGDDDPEDTERVSVRLVPDAEAQPMLLQYTNTLAARKRDLAEEMQTLVDAVINVGARQTLARAADARFVVVQVEPPWFRAAKRPRVEGADTSAFARTGRQYYTALSDVFPELMQLIVAAVFAPSEPGGPLDYVSVAALSLTSRYLLQQVRAAPSLNKPGEGTLMVDTNRISDAALLQQLRELPSNSGEVFDTLVHGNDGEDDTLLVSMESLETLLVSAAYTGSPALVQWVVDAMALPELTRFAHSSPDWQRIKIRMARAASRAETAAQFTAIMKAFPSKARRLALDEDDEIFLWIVAKLEKLFFVDFLSTEQLYDDLDTRARFGQQYLAVMSATDAAYHEAVDRQVRLHEWQRSTAIVYILRVGMAANDTVIMERILRAFFGMRDGFAEQNPFKSVTPVKYYFDTTYLRPLKYKPRATSSEAKVDLYALFYECVASDAMLTALHDDFGLRLPSSGDDICFSLGNATREHPYFSLRSARVLWPYFRRTTIPADQYTSLFDLFVANVMGTWDQPYFRRSPASFVTLQENFDAALDLLLGLCPAELPVAHLSHAYVASIFAPLLPGALPDGLAHEQLLAFVLMSHRASRRTWELLAQRLGARPGPGFMKRALELLQPDAVVWARACGVPLPAPLHLWLMWSKTPWHHLIQACPGDVRRRFFFLPKPGDMTALLGTQLTEPPDPLVPAMLTLGQTGDAVSTVISSGVVCLQTPEARAAVLEVWDTLMPRGEQHHAERRRVADLLAEHFDFDPRLRSVQSKADANRGKK